MGFAENKHCGGVDMGAVCVCVFVPTLSIEVGPSFFPSFFSFLFVSFLFLFLV